MWKAIPFMLVLGCTGAGDTDTGDTDAPAQTPAPLPLTGEYEGKTFESWTETWWQWVFGLPVTGHPLFDATGDDCGAGQGGPVWFLGGTFDGQPTTRSCTIPAGKSLFFPIVNAVWDNGGVPLEDQMTNAEMQAGLTEWLDEATHLKLTIDGEEITDLTAYRLGPVQFSYTLAASDSLYDNWGLTGWDGTTIDPSFTEGYWILFAPLPAGEHDLALYAELGDFVIDVTYQLTVE
jgi:hypothetical protein